MKKPKLCAYPGCDKPYHNFDLTPEALQALKHRDTQFLKPTAKKKRVIRTSPYLYPEDLSGPSLVERVVPWIIAVGVTASLVWVAIR